MRDAFGGIVNITMIVVFLVVVSGYLAFNVTYTKAFRMKNQIITTLEQYEGCQSNKNDCKAILDGYAASIGYSSPATNYCAGWDECNSKYAWKKIRSNTGNGSKSYYEVETVISIDIPIINKVMANMQVFRLKGSTKLINVY